MTAPDETKICPMCCMAIPAAAKKCPHCRHWQYLLSRITEHPASFLLVSVPFLIPLLLLSLRAHEPIFDRGQPFRAYSEQVTARDTVMRFGTYENNPCVSVLGWIRNDSDVDWKELVVQVEYWDADGNLADASQYHSYSMYVPAHDEIVFRFSTPRQFPQELYASHSVRVITAKDGAAGL